MSGAVAEATVLRNYLDWLIDLPRHKETKDSTDLNAGEDILNEDHYGLEEVKERDFWNIWRFVGCPNL